MSFAPKVEFSDYPHFSATKRQDAIFSLTLAPTFNIAEGLTLTLGRARLVRLFHPRLQIRGNLGDYADLALSIGALIIGPRITLTDVSISWSAASWRLRVEFNPRRRRQCLVLQTRLYVAFGRSVSASQDSKRGLAARSTICRPPDDYRRLSLGCSNVVRSCLLCLAQRASQFCERRAPDDAVGVRRDIGMASCLRILGRVCSMAAEAKSPRDRQRPEGVQTALAPNSVLLRLLPESFTKGRPKLELGRASPDRFRELRIDADMRCCVAHNREVRAWRT